MTAPDPPSEPLNTLLRDRGHPDMISLYNWPLRKARAVSKVE